MAMSCFVAFALLSSVQAAQLQAGSKSESTALNSDYAKAKWGCFFMTEHGMNHNCNHEYDEQQLFPKWIPANASVLELGSRYGVASCAISKQLQNSGKHVAVEPDHKAIAPNNFNSHAKSCNYHLKNGAVTKEPLDTVENWTPLGETTLAKGEKARFMAVRRETPALSVDGLQKEFGLKFDTLVADCEGCVINFFQENPTFVKQLNQIVMEVDYKKKEEHYDEAFALFKKEGLLEVDSANNGEHKVFVRGGDPNKKPATPKAITEKAKKIKTEIKKSLLQTKKV